MILSCMFGKYKECIHLNVLITKVTFKTCYLSGREERIMQNNLTFFFISLIVSNSRRGYTVVRFTN